MIAVPADLLIELKKALEALEPGKENRSRALRIPSASRRWKRWKID